MSKEIKLPAIFKDLSQQLTIITVTRSSVALQTTRLSTMQPEVSEAENKLKNGATKR